MNLREAAQQALEALERIAYWSEELQERVIAFDKGIMHWRGCVGEANGILPTLRAALADTQDWDEIEALRASLREHMAEIHRLRAAGRQALDAMDYTRWAVADYAQKWGIGDHDKAANKLRAALADEAMQRLPDVQQEMEAVTICHVKEGDNLSPPSERKDLSEESLNELVEELKNLGSLGKFKPTHMLFNAKALEYCKKLAEERDVPETNFVNYTLAVHVGYRYQSPVGGWEYGDHIPAGFDTQKWAHQKIYILQEQS